MSIKVKSFMGIIGFEMRKIMPKVSSDLYLALQSRLRKKENMKFSKMRNQQESIYPVYIAIETINRCNGSYAFCPVNHKQESRPFAKMSQELFDKIINEVASWDNWNGVFSLYVNNEPFTYNFNAMFK